MNCLPEASTVLETNEVSPTSDATNEEKRAGVQKHRES